MEYFANYLSLIGSGTVTERDSMNQRTDYNKCRMLKNFAILHILLLHPGTQTERK